MNRLRRLARYSVSRFWLIVLGALALAASPAASLAADVRGGWGNWWLPPDRSEHGGGIDALFIWTFWITMIVFIIVEIVLVWFLFKYRYRNDRRKAHFTHGNTRLEMGWTIAPAIIFIALAVANKGVWERLRFNPALDAKDTARVLVIGEQFKWNFIYPGPDGKFGKYLVYPKPTDTKWPQKWDAAKKAPVDDNFAGVPGPASLPYEKAVARINEYIGNENRHGKVWTDPDGLDDNFDPVPGSRALYIPVNRPVEVQLSSKDVIHDFFLPNFRVKLDAVPGLRGRIPFTAKLTSAEMVKEQKMSLDQLEALLAQPGTSDFVLRIDEKTNHPNANKDRTGWRFMNNDSRKTSIIRNDAPFPEDKDQRKAIFDKLRKIDVKEVVAYQPGYWEIVCEELCGANHYTMRGQMYVISQEEYAQKFEGKSTAVGAASTQPTKVAAAAN